MQSKSEMYIRKGQLLTYIQGNVFPGRSLLSENWDDKRSIFGDFLVVEYCV